MMGLDAGVLDASCLEHSAPPETGLPCGRTLTFCDATMLCCGGLGGGDCAASCNPITEAPIRCDGPEDCTMPGQVCCGDLTKGLLCTALANCQYGTRGRFDEYYICNSSA